MDNTENSSSAWQDLRPRDRMEYLLNTGHLSDCSFVVYSEEGERITLKCHKFILMCASPVFERMFEGDFSESKMPDNIVLDDISASDFRKFIEYLYWYDNRKLEKFEVQTLQNLLYLGKKFMVSNVINICLSTIKSQLATLDNDSIVDLYEYAHQIDDDDLIERISSKITANQSSFLRAQAIYDLSSELFLKFISIFDHSTSEAKRFDVIDCYCKLNGLVDHVAAVPSVPSAPKIYDKEAKGEREIVAKKINTKSTTTEHTQKDLNHNETETKNDENITVIGKEVKAETEVDNVTEITKDDDKTQVEIDEDALLKKKQENENEKREKHRKEFIKKLLSKVKFESMSPYEFTQGPGRSGLLTVDEKYDLLSKICITEHNNTPFKFNYSSNKWQ